jgi:hypothetical protein
MTYQFSPYIRDNLEFLQQLSKTKSDKKKNSLILNANADQILAIVEICANILRYNFILTPQQKKRLIKFADYYRAIARARTEKTARKRIQQGSGLALGAILLPIVATLAEHFVKKILPQQ